MSESSVIEMPVVGASAGNQTFDPKLAAGFVVDPLARWACERPGKAALVSRDVHITYQDLDRRTNQIARALRGLGVRRGDRVAFVLNRGPRTVLLLIGILKSGAAYVPLDASSPLTRIKDCIEDSQPGLLVLEDIRKIADNDQALRRITSLEDLLIAADLESGDELPSPEFSLNSSDLAYIIFTSGSTGRPKGVPITHASLTNFVSGNQRDCIRVEHDDVVFQGFSPASDGHHEEVWPTLTAGATLAVATSKEAYSGIDLGEFLNQFKVTVISCAPTLLSMLDADVPSLRRILFGAENLPAALVKRWWRPGRTILNTYGPTEATVGATFSECLPDEPITIGRPLPNYYCFVADEALELVSP